MDLALDNKENAFSKSMRIVYQACAYDKNRKDITRRTFTRIEEHLAQTTNKSPFALAKKDMISRIISVHKSTVVDCIQPSLGKALAQLRASLSDLMDSSADEAEVAAKKSMRKILAELVSELDSAWQDLEKVERKYEK